MSLHTHLARTAAVVSRWGLRSVFKRNGGVLPGTIALRIDPDLLASLAGSLAASVVITGTNGKTTTTNLIADALAASGRTVVCNRAGNNMEAGIAAALLEAPGGRSDGERVGVFECDELYTVRVLPKLKPTHFVLLNLFRDQLDRYGEIDHTQQVIAEALASSPATVLIYNADDPLCAAIAARVPNPCLPFGIEGATDTETTRISESRFCPACGTPLDYDYVQYGQLGAYRCPSCEWGRPALARQVRHVELGCAGYTFEVAEAGAQQAQAGAEPAVGTPAGARAARIDTRYNGLYMVYNVAAAYIAAVELGGARGEFQRVLDAYVPAGGRMATWEVAGRRVQSNLAKNPVGFDRQIQQIKTSGGRLGAFFLNDNDADGHDVSWIWDVDFERIADTVGLRAFAGGTRAHDMQVRLKYAGIDAALIGGIEEALASITDEPATETLFAVANYTAFPPLVKELENLAAREAQAPRPSTATAPTPQPATDAAAPRELARPVRIVHLYPDALNLYGDGGNAIVMAQRLRWRGIPVTVDEVTMESELSLLDADIVLMGGGADRDQLAVAHELLAQRETIAAYVQDGGALLAICGSYQLLGRSYYMGDERLEGLGVIDAETVRGEGRLIGNVAVQTELATTPFVGFENHGGRTHLGDSEQPLGRAVVAGTGNDGMDGSEGVLHDGVIGTYLHGPALSKNPELADWLITRALTRRAEAGDAQAAALLPLATLDDRCEHAAHDAAMKLLP